MLFGAPSNQSQAIALVISSNDQNYNVRDEAVLAGWDEATDVIVTVTVNTGVEVTASSTGTYAFDTGNFGAPLLSLDITVASGAYIVGKGGAGGDGGDGVFPGSPGATSGSAGSSGGPAFRAQDTCTLINNGTIGGGGAGGTGGAGWDSDVSGEQSGGGGGGGGAGYGGGGSGGNGASPAAGTGSTGGVASGGGGGTAGGPNGSAGATGGALGNGTAIQGVSNVSLTNNGTISGAQTG